MSILRSTLLGGLAAASLLTASAGFRAEAAPAVQARAAVSAAAPSFAPIETVGCHYRWHRGCWGHRVWRHHVWHYY